MKKNSIISVSDDKKNRFHIRPSDISTQSNAVGSFGKAEIEWAAYMLVLFFQQKNMWHKFTILELGAFYKKNKQALGANLSPNHFFYGLYGYWFDDSPGRMDYYETHPYIVLQSDGYFYVTEEFINRCAGN